MKNIIGTQVQSEKYGKGEIIAISDTMIMTISFPEEGEKRFMYPDAFCKSIQSEDPEIQVEAEEAWLIKKEKKEQEAREAAEREAAEKEAAKARKSHKYSKNNTSTISLTPEEIEGKIKELNEMLSGIDTNAVFSERTQRIFIVHQGKTYFEELSGCYIWAPMSGIHHHERLQEVRPGDIVFNYANGNLQAVSEAVSGCFASPRPSALAGHGWGISGYRVQLRYEQLTSPLSLDPITNDICKLKASIYSSFDSAGNACQGYFYELETSIAQLIKALILSTPHSAGVSRILARI